MLYKQCARWCASLAVGALVASLVTVGLRAQDPAFAEDHGEVVPAESDESGTGSGNSEGPGGVADTDNDTGAGTDVDESPSPDTEFEAAEVDDTEFAPFGGMGALGTDADDDVTEVDTRAELTSALQPSGCTSGDTVRLTGDIGDVANRTILDVNCNATIDLNGHQLITDWVLIRSNRHPTITDLSTAGTPGRLDAQSSGSNRPGISTTAATLTIEGRATVEARGDRYGYGAGIGGGNSGAGGALTVEGDARVKAIGGGHAAGIGGGAYTGAGGNLTVGPGAEVTASGGTTQEGNLARATAVGPGRDGTSTGTMTISGTLRIAERNLRIIHGAAFTVTDTGLITGPAGNETGEGANPIEITGSGTITNQGTITLSNIADDVTVTGNNYRVSFAGPAGGGSGDGAETVVVYAPTFAAGHRTLPSLSASGEWNTRPDGHGTVVDEDILLSGVAPDGEVTLYPVHRVHNWVELVASTAAEPGCGATVLLGADIQDGTSRTTLPVGCDLTLDLAGHELVTGTVDILADAHLTLTDAGTDGDAGRLDAQGSTEKPGIGTADAELTIEGRATVTAHGGRHAAGIGGGSDEHGGTVTIGGDSSVEATGGGGTSAARSGAGIGGGYDGSGGDLHIETHATVTASASFATASAVGPGSSGFLGNTVIEGTLIIPKHSLRARSNTNITVASTGKILGPEGDETGEGAGVAIVGDGEIKNHGIIALTDVANSVIVTGHNYAVTFTKASGDTDSVRVYAPMFKDSFRDFPAAAEGYEWNTGDTGRGTVVTETTPLTDVPSADGRFTLHEVLPVVDTTTTLAISDTVRADGPVIGEHLTLTATVSPTESAITPTGKVRFTAETLTGTPETLGEIDLDGDGVAVLDDVTFEPGTYALQAVYIADPIRFEGSESTVQTVTMSKAPVMVQVSATPESSTVLYDQPYTVTAQFFAAIDPDACASDVGSTMCPALTEGEVDLNAGTTIELDATGTAAFSYSAVISATVAV